jgi:hypothetical protein
VLAKIVLHFYGATINGREGACDRTQSRVG